MALVGNMFAKDAGGTNYNLSLDQFSLDILKGTYDAVEQATTTGMTVGIMDRNFFQEADWNVWASKGMGHLFPGNIQFSDFEKHRDPELAKQLFSSRGAEISLRMGQEFAGFGPSLIDGIGSRPADFTYENGFRTIEGNRFITVYDDTTGSIEAFWDKNIYLSQEEWPSMLSQKQFGSLANIQQINNTPRSKNHFDYMAGNAIREYLQAGNKHIQTFNPNIEAGNNYLDALRRSVASQDAGVLLKKGGKFNW
jgi:hypothetical protein